MVSPKCVSVSTVGLGRQPCDDGLPVEDDQHANDLQRDEWHHAAINGRDFDAFRGNALQVKDSEAHGRCKKARLQTDGK